MNILILVPALTVGGGEIFAVRLANALSVKHQVTLMDLKPGNRNAHVLHRIQPQVKVVSGDVPFSGPELLFRKILVKAGLFFPFLHRLLARSRAQGFASFLHDYVENNKIDVVNSHMASADWHAFQYFKKGHRRAKFIVSMHGCYNRAEKSTDPKRTGPVKNRGHIFGAADHIVLLTPKNALPLAGHRLKNEPVYIPLGLENISPPPGITRNKNFTFILVSRAIERKGWEEAIEAVSTLRTEGHTVDLLLVGGGGHQEALQKKHAKDPFIQFTGESSEVTAWIHRSDVGLFPSCIESESYPNAVIEYLACGKPVIGTDIGEVAHMISTPGSVRAGFLLDYHPEGISVGQLVFFMKKYLTDVGLLPAHRLLAREAFQKFDMKKCVSAYEMLYK